MSRRAAPKPDEQVRPEAEETPSRRQAVRRIATTIAGLAGAYLAGTAASCPPLVNPNDQRNWCDGNGVCRYGSCAYSYAYSSYGCSYSSGYSSSQWYSNYGYGSCSTYNSYHSWCYNSITSTPYSSVAPAYQSSVGLPGDARLGKVWRETEGGGWVGVFTRRGSTNTFDAVWTLGAARVTGVLTMSVSGKRVEIQSRQQSNGRQYDYVGTLSEDARSIVGTLSPAGTQSPATPWRAAIEH